MAFSLLILNVIFFRNHVSGVPKKKFQCPIKMPKKVVCLVVLYPNVRFFIWSSGTFLWDGRTFFLGHAILFLSNSNQTFNHLQDIDDCFDAEEIVSRHVRGCSVSKHKRKLTTQMQWF